MLTLPLRLSVSFVHWLTQLHKSKLQQVSTCKEALPALACEATALLQASDAEVVTICPEFKRKMAQLEAAKTSACANDRAGIDQLNESIAALHKTALAVPSVQVNLCGSQILSQGAKDLQQMLGDMKLVSCKRL